MRQTVARLFVALGIVLVAAALGIILWARLAPHQGLEDLGWFVFGLLLLSVAGVPFALALLTAPRAGRAFVLGCGAGCALAVVAAFSFLTTGTPGLMALGALVLVLALAGALRGVGLWRAARA